MSVKMYVKCIHIEAYFKRSKPINIYVTGKTINKKKPLKVSAHFFVKKVKMHSLRMLFNPISNAPPPHPIIG